MCTVKAPKPKDPVVKDPQYLRNPWLDSLSMTRSGTVGRNALRVDGARAPTGAPVARLPSPPPGSGGGGYGGGSGGGYGGGGSYGGGGGNTLPLDPFYTRMT
jgi:uncharacterized membrane protein YgcG